MREAEMSLKDKDIGSRIEQKASDHDGHLTGSHHPNSEFQSKDCPLKETTLGRNGQELAPTSIFSH